MESEKAKAKAGKLYDANNDIELVSEREACKEVCYELNSLRPSQKKERESIIRRLFGKTGKSFLIEQPFYCDYGYNIEIGENFYSNVNCVILDGGSGSCLPDTLATRLQTAYCRTGIRDNRK